MDFASLGLIDPLLRAVAEQGYTTPSPIQAQAIPAVLEGRDAMAAAQTGTGKTAGFVLPILQRLSATAPAHPHRIRALIITPTRELAAQVADSVVTYGRHLPLKSAVVFGGVKINPQIATLRKGVDILVASDMPQNSGLSSSASFTVGFGFAISELLGFDLDPVALALAARAVENRFFVDQIIFFDRF